MQTLRVLYADGTSEDVSVRTGSQQNARRLPVRVGRALCAGEAVAIALWDGKARTAVCYGRTYFCRIAR